MTLLPWALGLLFAFLYWSREQAFGGRSPAAVLGAADRYAQIVAAGHDISDHPAFDDLR